MMNESTRRLLEAALAGEALAALRYRLFAEQADEEGYDEIAAQFDRIGKEERREHVREIAAQLGLIGPTRENLATAIRSEVAEHRRMYPHFAAEARQAGDLEAALLFQELGADEQTHAEALRGLFDETFEHAASAVH
jgi:rubrerythrin